MIKEQSFKPRTFSNLNRLKNERVIASSFIAITDKTLTDIKQNTSDNAWFQIDELPKLGFDHEQIINEVITELRKKITTNYDDILIKILPNAILHCQNFKTFMNMS